MAGLEFGVLGPLEVRRDGELIALPAPKQRALLGLLLLHANEPVPLDELLDRLWGGDPPPTARASLYNHVHALRRLVGPERLERQPAGYVLHVGPEQLDLARFERLVDEARRAEPRERAAKLRQALSYWRGPALVEFPSEPFAQGEIHRLEEERLAALEARIDAELDLGLHSELVAELETLVARHPLRERLWVQLMLALYRAGRQADALATYRRAHQAFTVELGVEPGVALRELERAILLHDPALDDGEQRLGSTLERAAALLPKPPSERAESLYEYGVALLRSGERRRAVSTLAAAERLAETAEAHGVQERARLYRSYLSVWTEGTSPLDHLSAAERAAQRLETLGDFDGLWLALEQQAQMHHLTGRPDAALQVAERCAELARRADEPWHRARSRTGIAFALADGSTPVAEAIARCEAELAAAEDEHASPMAVLGALAVLYAEAGRVDDSRAAGAQAASEARGAGMLWALLEVMWRQAAAEVTSGNLGEAIAHLRASQAISEAEYDRAGGLIAAAELARLLAATGELDEARRLALAARAATSPDLFMCEVLWRRALAHVAASDGRTREALRLSDEARVRTAASEYLTLHAQTVEEAATIHSLAGNAAQAVESLREALANYERKGNVVGAARVRRALEHAV